MSEKPADIRSIIQDLTSRNIQVAGPTQKAGESVYLVNGHTLTEQELRILAQENELSKMSPAIV